MNQIIVGEKWTGAIAHADGVCFNGGGNSLREGQIWTRNGAGRRNTITRTCDGS